MLSKVISGKHLFQGSDESEVTAFQPPVFEPAVFPAVDARYSQPTPPRAQPDGNTETDAELRSLRDQIQRLQTDLVNAKRESHEAGRRMGEQQTRAEIGPVIERMNASIAELGGLRAQMRRSSERDVVQLAILIAKRILHREINVDPSALTALARVVFERMARADSCRVTVHPSFVPAISAALTSAQASRISIQPDPDCDLGTLTIQSDEGIIDASVESQLDEITRGLTDRLSNSGGRK